MDRFQIINVRSLLPRPSSADPVPPPNPKFIEKLEAAIHTCRVNSSWRTQRYGDKAQESRAGFTPDDVREEYKTLQDEFKRLDALPTPGSCNSSDTQIQLHPTVEIRFSSLSVEVEDSSLAVPTPNFASADAEAPTNYHTKRKRRYSRTNTQQATDHHVRKKRTVGSDETQNDSGKISRATLERRKEEKMCQLVPDFLRKCPAQNLKNLQRSARHGGPDLSDLRGVRYMPP